MCRAAQNQATADDTWSPLWFNVVDGRIFCVAAPQARRGASSSLEEGAVGAPMRRSRWTPCRDRRRRTFAHPPYSAGGPQAAGAPRTDGARYLTSSIALKGGNSLGRPRGFLLHRAVPSPFTRVGSYRPSTGVLPLRQPGGEDVEEHGISGLLSFGRRGRRFHIADRPLFDSVGAGAFCPRPVVNQADASEGAVQLFGLTGGGVDTVLVRPFHHPNIHVQNFPVHYVDTNPGGGEAAFLPPA